MELNQFIKEHKIFWSQLETNLELFSKRGKKITATQIDQLTNDYKQTSSHLAYIRTYYPNDELVHYLNALVSRAHNVLFKEQFKTSHQLSYFFKTYFISLVEQRRTAIIIAFLLFMFGTISGFIAVWLDPLNKYNVLPTHIANAVDPDRLGEGHDSISNPEVSAEIMTNNIKVAIMAFAGGITFGLLTVYVLIQNGILIGAFAAIFMHANKSYDFWAYILPHGIIELMAIFISGGAGLYMGYRMAVPGKFSRKYIFLKSTRESAMLLMGTVPLFIIAAIIEGFITPSSLSLEIKYAVAFLTLLLLIAYYLYGRLKYNHSASLDLTSR